MATLCVIATVLNEAEEIAGLLESLRIQMLQPDEIVIVDGGSTDGTLEYLLAAQEELPALRAIRDESCSLKYSAGPIARGRNVAIAAASAEWIACADGGCTYDDDWLELLIAPLHKQTGDGTAEYTLGGSRLDLTRSTVWDAAAAPFLGVKLAKDEPTKSCTARSMAFTREAWKRAGGFPESIFIGEDVLFDQVMRQHARTAFAAGAKAIYTPRNTFGRAVAQVSSYAIADGVAGMRPARLLRNVLRCVAELAALLLLPVSIVPLFVVLALEVYFAYRLDWQQVSLLGPAVLLARLVFSLLVPWIVSWQQVRGLISKRYRVNRQNTA